MKSILNKKWYGVPVLVFALVAVLGVGMVVYAAMTVTTHGTVTVVAPGGGGGGTPPPLTYLFKLYDAATAGNEIAAEDSAFFNLGSITQTYSTEKTIYIEKTGTGNVTVTPSATWTGAVSGNFTFTPPSVSLVDATRLPIVVKFTAGPVPAAASGFDISFVGSP